MEMHSDLAKDFYFLQGGGEMGALIRKTDWSKTSLGNPSEWPQSLRTAVAIMLDNPFGMYIAWGSDYTQLYNDGYRPILGTNKHPQALGISSRETFSEIWHIIGSMFDGVMNGKAVGFPDFMLPLNRNGYVEECYFDFSYSPIRKETGEVGGILVTVIETTEKKKATDALKESEERFKTMAEASNILISVADKDLNTTFFNKAWSDFTGRTVENLMNFGWKDIMHPEDLQNFLERFQQAFQKKESFSDEFRIKNANGEYRWVMAKIPTRFNPDGTHAGFVSSCIDITDIKQTQDNLQKSEEQMRSMVESAPFPIGVYIGKEMRVQLANKSIMDIWGKGNQVIGKLFSEVLPELDNQDVFKQLDEVFETGKPFHIKNQHLDLVIDGKLKPFFFNYSLTPLFDAYGKVYGVMNTGADVTDMNLAKQKIQESENKLRNTILQAPIAMCIFMGPLHVVELANDRMFELWGKPGEVFLNKPLFEGLHEASNQGFEELLDSVYQKGETVSAQGIPVTLPRNDKLELLYVDILYQPYRDVNHEISGVLAVAVDVTAKVLAQKKIEEAEEKTRLAIYSAALGVYEITYATNEMITDERFKEIWGVDASVKRDEYAAVLHPDDLLHRQQEHERSLKTGQLNYQTRIIWKDKSVHWVKITGKVQFDEKGAAAKLVGVIQDVTDSVLAQKKIEASEINLRNMILQAPVAMCIFRGSDYVVEIANNNMFELWGKQKDEVLNKPIFEGLPEAKEQGLETLLQHVYTTGERFEANEMPVNLPRNGEIETIYINFVYEAQKSGDDTIIGILAVAIDVTPQVIARQKIEEIVAQRTKALAQANINLQKSNNELAQFAYIASHDLQEPLRKITTFANMMENSLGDRIDDTSKKYLNKINASSVRMHKLIRDVLTYSELVKENDIFVPVNLNEIIDEIKTDYELLIEQKNAVINCESIPVIEAIPLQMSQLFGNLISNALKFVKKDVHPIIHITVRMATEEDLQKEFLEKNNSYCVIQFKDNGIGIKEEFTDQIFQIFQRLHRKSEFEGTGIGLAMCKKITLNHHGNLNATGSSEQGAVFNIFLPIKQMHQNAGR